MSDVLPADADGFDPDARALCPDDACIGVLDGTGRCKVCGRQGVAAPAASVVAPELAVYSQAATAGDSAAASFDAELASDSAAEADNDDFADRHLCIDPGCIGVLDAAGRCKECGRVAETPPAP